MTQENFLLKINSLQEQKLTFAQRKLGEKMKRTMLEIVVVPLYF